MEQLERLRNELYENDLDGILITNKTNRRYLCGFTGSSGLLYVTQEEIYLITDGRYTEQAHQQTNGMDIQIVNIDQPEWSLQQEIRRNESRIGFEGSSIPYQVYKQLTNLGAGKQFELVETSEFVEKLRMRKSPREVALLREAAKLADQTFAYILGVIRPGMTELEVANEIDYYGKGLGSAGPAFETIVASGKRTALPHAHASKKVIQGNELIMIDFGTICEGYYSDMTRTFALGKVSDEQKDMYHKVLTAQKHAISALKVGVPLKEIDKAARDILAGYGLEQYFTHGLGHGIGLSCHEYPRLSSKSEEKICQAMTFTVEPGVYLPQKYGVRIEDDILIDENGNVEILTKAPKEWVEI